MCQKTQNRAASMRCNWHTIAPFLFLAWRIQRAQPMQLMRIAAGLTLALAAPVWGANLQVIGSALNDAYKNREMMQRVFYSGSMVRYAADGSFAKGGKPGPWTLDSSILCRSIRMKAKELVIRGNRVYFAYDENKKKLEPFLGPNVSVDIAADPATVSIASLQESIAKVFVTGSEHREAFMPGYWQPYLRSAVAAPRRSSSQPRSTPKPTPNLVFPRPLYDPKPHYTPEARQAHIQGSDVLKVVIGADGKVSSDSIVKPLGMGLDDNAAETVRTWKFKPATRNGVPVDVKVTVVVTFRLAQRLH
jgi:TonB family protein